MTFAQSLAWGQMGESAVARWLRRNSYHILPVYEKETDDDKGPRVFLCEGRVIAPDMLAFHTTDIHKTRWVESKRKTRFSWYGKGGYFVTGINYRHYQDYQRLALSSPFPVWLLFLHERADTWPPDVQKWNAPPNCPTGLYGCRLETPHSHIAKDCKNVELIYWRYENLKPFATLSELEEVEADDTQDVLARESPEEKDEEDSVDYDFDAGDSETFLQEALRLFGGEVIRTEPL